MKIRKAKKSELGQLAKIYHKEMAPHFREVHERPIGEKRYLNILHENFPKSRIFVIDDSGIKGFVWYIKEGKEINIEEICATGKRKGYGRALMNSVVEYAREKGVKQINLDVHSKNKRAINFFKKFKFSERTIEMSRGVR